MCRFLRQLSVPILGILENMSGFSCPHCGKNVDIFKSGGGEKAAKELNVPFLGRLPLDPKLVEAADSGESFIEIYPGSEPAKAIEKICDSIDNNIRKKE